MARFASCAVSQRDRNGAQQRRHGRHHDRTEPDQAPFVDGVYRSQSLASLGVEREIDLHDRVLLHDADQHDQSDEGIDVQIHSEQDQGYQRAEARRRQPGQDRERMDVALVQNSENDVHDHDRDDQQQP